MILYLLLGCAPSDKTQETIPEAMDTGFCSDAPTVTYETFGEGFMSENCQSCHASTSPNRYGAPEDIYFDTHEDIINQAATILAVTTGEAPTMPPAGGVDEQKRELVEIWLSCWENEQ